MSGRQILGGRLAARAVPAIPLGSDMLGIDVVNVQDGPQPHSRGLGVQFGFAPSRTDRLPAGLRSQIALAGYIEVDPVYLIGACGDHIDEQGLDVIESTGLNGERGLALVPDELAFRPAVAPRTLQAEP